MTYRGVLIVGGSAAWTPPSYQRARDLQAVFGSDGLAMIDGGQHGGTSSAVGVLIAGDVATLGTFLADSRALQDGQAGDLVDPFGQTWSNVVLQRFGPLGRVLQGQGSWSLRVRAEFLHLS